MFAKITADARSDSDRTESDQFIVNRILLAGVQTFARSQPAIAVLIHKLLHINTKAADLRA